MSVSVVIPLYNKAATIQRAVESVLNQTCREFELIIIDDGSTDSSVDLLKSLHDPRIHIHRQENHGASSARNTGVALARNTIIAFLDGDDYWQPTFLEKINSLVRDYPNCGIYAVSSDLYMDQQVIWKSEPIYPRGWRGIIDDYIGIMLDNNCGPFNASSFAVDKNILHELGSFPCGVAYGEDAVIWFKFAVFSKIAYCHEPLARYDLDADNRSSRKHVDLTIEYPAATFLRNMLITKKHSMKHIRSARE